MRKDNNLNYQVSGDIIDAMVNEADNDPKKEDKFIVGEGKKAKILVVVFSLICIVINIISFLFHNGEIWAVYIFGAVGALCYIYSVFIFRFKVYVEGDSITVRKFFLKKKSDYSQIDYIKIRGIYQETNIYIKAKNGKRKKLFHMNLTNIGYKNFIRKAEKLEIKIDKR